MEFLFSVKSSVPFCFCWETVWMMTLCTCVLGRANERLSFLKLEISIWRIYGEREVFKGEGKQCALSVGRVMGMRCWLCCGTIHRRCLVALTLPDSLTWRHARQLELKVLWPVELPVNTLYFLIQLSIMPRLYLNTQQAVCFVLYWFFPVILSIFPPLQTSVWYVSVLGCAPSEANRKVNHWMQIVVLEGVPRMQWEGGGEVRQEKKETHPR